MSELTLVRAQLLLECVLELARNKTFAASAFRGFETIMRMLQSADARIYRPSIQIIFELIQYRQYKSLILTYLEEDVYKQQYYDYNNDNKLCYRNSYRTVGRICDLLGSTEPPEFLRAASAVLAALAEQPSGDTVLKESGVIRPIMCLLNVENQQNRLSACEIICGICEKCSKTSEKVQVSQPPMSKADVCQSYVSKRIRSMRHFRAVEQRTELSSITQPLNTQDLNQRTPSIMQTCACTTPDADISDLPAIPLLPDEGINMQVASDLRPCAQILVNALNKQMWAIRRENGEIDQLELEQQREYEAELRRLTFAGEDTSDLAPPKRDTTKSEERIYFKDKQNISDIRQFESAVSQMLHALTDILTCAQTRLELAAACQAEARPRSGIPASASAGTDVHK